MSCLGLYEDSRNEQIVGGCSSRGIRGWFVNVSEQHSYNRIFEAVQGMGREDRDVVEEWYCSRHAGRVNVKRKSFSFSRSVGDLEAILQGDSFCLECRRMFVASGRTGEVPYLLYRRTRAG